MSGCCPPKTEKKSFLKRFDFILWGSLFLIAPSYIFHIFDINITPSAFEFTASVFELVNRMWIGVLVGIFFVGLLDKVPRELVASAFGHKKGLSGICRATLAGTLLDLCSHGILLIGMKLYERGATLGQTMAFLIASPWNSISLTVILFSLIGVKWTLLFIVFSMIIAVISGLIFEHLVENKTLPANPNIVNIPDNFCFKSELKKLFRSFTINRKNAMSVLKSGMEGSKMILRWVFFGIIIASLIRNFVSQEMFEQYFGSTLMGLMFTLLAATIIEVCSEGSAPIAADIMTRADSPGNSFVFLMAGVSTDYTEIMALKETTKSWKISLFLPLVTLPQVLMIGWLINNFGV